MNTCPCALFRRVLLSCCALAGMTLHAETMIDMADLTPGDALNDDSPILLRDHFNASLQSGRPMPNRFPSPLPR